MLYPRRSIGRPEARDRAQQRCDGHLQLVHRRHQGRGSGYPGDCRVERSGSLYDREQLPRRGGRKLHPWRFGSADSRSDYPGRRLSAQPSRKTRGMAVGEVGGEKNLFGGENTGGGGGEETLWGWVGGGGGGGRR